MGRGPLLRDTHPHPRLLGDLGRDDRLTSDGETGVRDPGPGRAEHPGGRRLRSQSLKRLHGQVDWTLGDTLETSFVSGGRVFGGGASPEGTEESREAGEVGVVDVAGNPTSVVSVSVSGPPPPMQHKQTTPYLFTTTHLGGSII